MAAQNAQNMYLEPKPHQTHSGATGHNGVGHDAELGHATTGQSQVPLTGGGPIGRQISVTLTPEQFEQLYLQPGGVGGKGDLSKRFGNPTRTSQLTSLACAVQPDAEKALYPTALGIAGFLLSLTPVSFYLMQFGSCASPR